MIFPSNRVRIMVATKPIDFRKGHDSLAAMVKNELRKDPQAWLADALGRLPDMPLSRLPELLPWNWKARHMAQAA